MLLTSKVDVVWALAWLLEIHSFTYTHTHTHNHIMASFSRTTWVSRCQKKSSSGLYGAREDNRDRHTIWLGATPSGLISDPPPSPPLFLRQMPFQPQLSHFILAWNRHQICWLAYPVAWFQVAWTNTHSYCGMSTTPPSHCCVRYAVTAKRLVWVYQYTLQLLWLVRMEWRPARWSVCLHLLISPCTIKSRSSLLAPANPGGLGKKGRKTVVVATTNQIQSC